MATDTTHGATRIHDLDMKHQSNLHQTELIHRDEELRRIKLRLLSLRDDNALLNDKISQKDAKQRALAKQNVFLGNELDEAKGITRAQEAKIKKQTIDLANLKAEIESFGTTIHDSSKVLQEKFALTREIDRMRPEMEHLKSQLSNQQAVVAEKHDLQRQLDTLEVELENEKRSRKRAQVKEDNGAIDELRSRIAEAEKGLAAERKDRENMKKDHQRELSEAIGHNERLEERISTLKTKLKGYQTELKDTRAKLEQCQSELLRTRTSTDKPNKTMTSTQTNRKRRVEESSFGDITIQTPGNDHTADKRPTKKKQAAVVEKSTFSVTPFLNRTKAIDEDTLASQETEPVPEKDSKDEALESVELNVELNEAAEEPREVMGPPPKPKVKVAPVSKTQKPRGRPKKALVEAPASEKNTVTQPEPPVLNPSIGRQPKDIASSEEQENAPMVKKLGITMGLHSKSKAQPSLARLPSAGLTAAAAIEAVEGKKKRRKLVGVGNGTIMQDDGETDMPPTPPPKTQLGGVRKRAPLGRAPLGGSVTNSFGGGASFSPLKRDRRGVNASFLA